MAKTTVILITLLGYKALLLAVGFWASKRANSSDDFFLGGRGLGPVVAALSYSSSAASAWVLLGLTGAAFSYGVSTIWLALGSISAMFVVWYWVAPRLHSFAREHDYITLSEVVAHQSTGVMRRNIILLNTLIIVASFSFYVAAQFQGAGKSFATSFDISLAPSIVLGAAVILVYTLLGGFWAVSVTDAIQGLLMALAAIAMPLVCYSAVGGLEGLRSGLDALGDPSLLSFTAENLFWYSTGLILGSLAIGLGTYGQPHLMARLMALKDEAALKQGRRITIGWYLIVFLGMWFVGLCGRVLFADLANNEQVFFAVLDGLFPVVLGAVFLAAVLSAIMSTADSQLLSASAAIANDLGLADKNPARALLISRITTSALVVVSVIIAIYLPDKIFSRVLFAWMALGAALGPILFFRLAKIGVSDTAVLASVSTGFITTVLLSFTPNAPGDIAERGIPFLLASVILWLGRSR